MLSEWDHRNRRGKALKQRNMETLNRRGRTGWGGCREEEQCLSSIQSAVPFLNLRNRGASRIARLECEFHP